MKALLIVEAAINVRKSNMMHTEEENIASDCKEEDTV